MATNHQIHISGRFSISVMEERRLYGGIDSIEELLRNLTMNCIPESVFEMSTMDYDQFLRERRGLMAKKIRDYYFSL
ncbi:MAG: hypothetical protein U5K79_02215 [Cyclobacteriaceae bacterium]|nr:hypothetical protein [Cyclobacteriaceae bacterium]